MIGYKYFAFHNLCTISVKIRHADGELYVKMIGKEDGNESKLCRIPLKRSEEWTEVSAEIIPEALSEVLQENSPGIWRKAKRADRNTFVHLSWERQYGVSGILFELRNVAEENARVGKIEKDLEPA